MNPSAFCRTVPLWMPLIVVSLVAASLWGILTVLGAGALRAVPSEIHPIVFALASVGNIMSALAALAFWPLITWAFWCTGILVASDDPPEFRDLMCGIGLAHLPVLIGMWVAWIIVTASDLSIPADATSREAIRRYLESVTSVRISRCVIVLAYVASGGCFVVVVHGLFKTSRARAVAIVALPLALYYLGISVLQRGIR